MTDDEIRNAFRHQPKLGAILLVAGYLFMFTHADRAGIALFTCGIAAIVLGVLLIHHEMTHGRWYRLVPAMVIGVAAGFAGAFAIIFSMAPYLPQ